MINWYPGQPQPQPLQFLVWSPAGSASVVTWLPQGYWGDIHTGQPVAFSFWCQIQAPQVQPPWQPPPWHSDPDHQDRPPWWHPPGEEEHH